MKNGYLNFEESDLLGESLYGEFWNSGTTVSRLGGVVCHVDKGGLLTLFGIAEYHVSIWGRFLI